MPRAVGVRGGISWLPATYLQNFIDCMWNFQVCWAWVHTHSSTDGAKLMPTCVEENKCAHVHTHTHTQTNVVGCRCEAYTYHKYREKFSTLLRLFNLFISPFYCTFFFLGIYLLYNWSCADLIDNYFVSTWQLMLNR